MASERAPARARVATRAALGPHEWWPGGGARPGAARGSDAACDARGSPCRARAASPSTPRCLPAQARSRGVATSTRGHAGGDARERPSPQRRAGRGLLSTPPARARRRGSAWPAPARGASGQIAASRRARSASLRAGSVVAARPHSLSRAFYSRASLLANALSAASAAPRLLGVNPGLQGSHLNLSQTGAQRDDQTNFFFSLSRR